VLEEHQKNAELALIHLRDARNILQGLEALPPNRALPKSVILLASAALESNLTYLAGIALRFMNARPDRFTTPQINFVRNVETTIDDNGKLVERRLNQKLFERMQIVPELLARTLGRHFELSPRSATARKLKLTIERRDAIVHPAWDRYVADIGWWEAAEAVDAVELYLQSVQRTMTPVLIGYTHMLLTIKGPTKHDVGVGHRTFGKRRPSRAITTMTENGVGDAITREWLDSMFMTEIALGHKSEADSPGSMLTRAALVLLYAMLEAQLAVASQWKIRESPSAFSEAEILFLNEVAVGIGHDGEVWLDSEQHPFKKRIKAIPSVLARCIDGVDFVIDLGGAQGQALLQGHGLRNQVMHSSPGIALPRVSKEELVKYSEAVRAYFSELATHAPKAFGHMRIFLNDSARLSKSLRSQFPSEE
jgi:hypothetical protein